MAIRTQNWTQYFTHNREHLMPVAWDSAYELTPQEIRTILESIQQFQLGESSEGTHFLKLAGDYARRTGDTAYLPALKLFIAEEQRHAAHLGRFMTQQGLPLAEYDPVDRIFRHLRHLVNLEMAIVVLLTAEIVAMTYYKALHDATQSPTLRGICRQILRDEIQHLDFQASTLTKIRQGRSRLGMMLTRGLQRILFSGTLLVVWLNHGRVYQAGGFTFRTFWTKTSSRYHHTFTN